jgi:inner membrane protein
MLAPTHSVFGIFLTLIILAVFGIQWSLHWTILLVAILGAIMPDIDHPKSVIGKMFYFISAPIERRYGHRTITHSFIGWVISSVIFALLVLFGVFIFGFVLKFEIGGLDLWPRWIAAFSISYMSHLLLDMLNPRGSQMFWPDPGRDVMPRNPKFRPESGSRVEILIFIILFALMLLAFPISKYGIASSLRWLLATPGSAIQEFKSLKTHTYVDFKGYFTETREPVEGTAEILDTDKQRLVILYQGLVPRSSKSEGGNIYTLSDELAADITASHVRIKRTNRPVKIEKKEFKNQSREYLLSQIPKGAFISGSVHLPEGMDIEFPVYPGTYKIMDQKGNDLILNYASREQIEKLALTEYFDLQKRKDQANLDQLEAQADKIKQQVRTVESGGGLTPLGRKILLSKEDIEKQQSQLAELKGQFDEINVKIDELKIKIKARKFVFSGEVYLRQ